MRCRAKLRVAAALIAVAAAATTVASTAVAATSPPFQGPTVQNPSTTPDFALHDQHGNVMRLTAQRGKVAIVTFLYTHCPDVCPLTAGNINSALRGLGAKRASVAVFAISVDPKGDTPGAVTSFVRSHRLLPQFHYLTGSQRQLQTVWDHYAVSSVAQSGDAVDHTLYTLLLDKNGKARVLFDALASSAKIEHDLRILLARS